MHHRILAACALLALLTGNAWADPREDTQAGIARCGANRDNRAYLDCIYGAVQPLRAALGLPPALPGQLRLAAQPPMMPSGTPPPAAAPPRSKGFLGGVLGGGTPDMRLSAYSFDKHGMFTVTLSDGEVWRQTADDTNYARLKGPASNYSVSVAEGGFGDAEMQVNGEATIFAVQRVR